MTDHPFDRAIALTALGDGRFTGATSPAYANMVGPFGGVSAATALNAVCRHPALLGEPLSLTVNFCAALADGPFEVRAEPVCTNRSTQHWTISLSQGGAVALTATAVTAVMRDTWSQLDAPAPAVPRPDAVAPPTMAPGVEWVRRYDMRFIEGPIPTAWDDSLHDSTTRLWMREAAPRPLEACGLAAMADIFYPRVWRRRATRVPVGTVSMTVYFHAGAAALAALGSQPWLLGQARSQVFAHGFFDQSAQLWSEAGTLLATTHQVVYFKG